MLFAEEENKKSACGQQEESRICQQAAPYAGRREMWASAVLGQDLHKVSWNKLHVSGVPGKAPRPHLPSQSP